MLNVFFLGTGLKVNFDSIKKGQGIVTMADIAILVVEEYERMVKLKAHKASVSAEVGRWNDSPANMTSFGIEENKIKSLKRKLEAKSQFALAVSNGFFSA
ncbi:hypothetical protein CARUB_v10002330mg [Capsella rubella]|uniref:Uncharacterized protein n=1 Tax=Capsella rubella TaxID=81985 RepID=R0HA40_9BRAS|nr:uncharacterized protein LOC17881922 [Capsella rubella]EOA21860.1 hypothetical protein CARUB_v10002330mg [Capsella rubella]